MNRKRQFNRYYLYNNEFIHRVTAQHWLRRCWPRCVCGQRGSHFPPASGNYCHMTPLVSRHQVQRATLGTCVFPGIGLYVSRNACVYGGKAVTGWLHPAEWPEAAHVNTHTQRTYPHDFAPLLYILPHGVDNVAAHVLSFSALLTHPHQTHPNRGENGIRRGTKLGQRVRIEGGGKYVCVNSPHMQLRYQEPRVECVGEAALWNKHTHQILINSCTGDI